MLSPWRAEFSRQWLIYRLGGVWFSYQSTQLNVSRICLGAAGWQLTLLLAPPRFDMTSPKVHLGAQGSGCGSHSLKWSITAENRGHVKMEFLKKIVPTGASGDVADVGSTARESSPRLLKMRRVRLFALGQTIDEDEETRVVHPDHCMYLCRQPGET